MMNYFGYYCPQCNTRVSIGVGPADNNNNPICTCGGIMEVDQNATPSAAQVYCSNCKSINGLVTSDRCPDCNGPWSKIPE
jgi:hypothetical protein